MCWNHIRATSGIVNKFQKSSIVGRKFATGTHQRQLECHDWLAPDP